MHSVKSLFRLSLAKHKTFDLNQLLRIFGLDKDNAEGTGIEAASIYLSCSLKTLSGERKMKLHSIIYSLPAFICLISGSAFSDTIEYKPQLVRLIPQDTFIPPGFDDNDSSQIMIAGNFPNTCYRAVPPTYEVDLAKKKILITNNAHLYPGCWCAPVQVPYLHTINLGILPVGQYEVLEQDNKNTLHAKGSLEVSESKSPSPDEFEYAPVQDVFMEDPNSTSFDPILVIRGRFESDCMRLKEVKVLYRTSHLIEVLPISTMDTGRTCNPAKVPFETKIKLQTQWKGSSLVYVRSLNGQAISKVIEL